MSQQALFFVKHSYSIGLSTTNTKCHEGDKFGLSTVPDSWDFSFETSNHCRTSMQARDSGESTNTQRRSDGSKTSAAANTELPVQQDITAKSPNKQSSSCKPMTNDIAAVHSITTDPPAIDPPKAYATTANYDIEDTTSTASVGSAVHDDGTTGNQTTDESHDGKDGPIQHDSSSEPSVHLSFDNLDTNAIFGDEDDDLERIIEEEEKGAAWRSCPQPNLDELKNPFEQGCKEGDFSSEEYCTRSTTEVCASVPSASEEQHRRFSSWAYWVNTDYFHKVPAHAPEFPYQRTKQQDDTLRTQVLRYNAFMRLDPEELFLHRAEVWPKGARAKFRPLHQYHPGTIGLKRLESYNPKLFPYTPEGAKHPSFIQTKKQYIDGAQTFFAPICSDMFKVENADEGPPSLTRQLTERNNSLQHEASSSEDEVVGSPSSPETSKSSHSSFSNEDAQSVECPNELSADGRESRTGFREEEDLPEQEIAPDDREEDVRGRPEDETTEAVDEKLAAVEVESSEDDSVASESSDAVPRAIIEHSESPATTTHDALAAD
ncbi:MAG: hypothetical protein M1821_000412 [Bathelium mastoideum]|nr:MAG: hypothetical protein M1821_000412 [Bathelium mastoideum]